jgi:hypothetical protein
VHRVRLFEPSEMSAQTARGGLPGPDGAGPRRLPAVGGSRGVRRRNRRECRVRGTESSTRGIKVLPELPEVETIKRDLRELVVGSGLRASSAPPALVEHPPPRGSPVRLKGARVVMRGGGRNTSSGPRHGRRPRAPAQDRGPVTPRPSGGGADDGPHARAAPGRGALPLPRDETGFTRARLLDAEGLEGRLSSWGPSR